MSHYSEPGHPPLLSCMECSSMNEHEANGMLAALGVVSPVSVLASDIKVTSKFLSVRTMEVLAFQGLTSTRGEVAA